MPVQTGRTGRGPKVVTCNRCGTNSLPGARFCDVCGLPLVSTPQVAYGAAKPGRPIAPVVAAGILAAFGILLLVGAITPLVGLVGEDGDSAKLTDIFGKSLGPGFSLIALVCVWACVAEFISFRDSLLLGCGIAVGGGIFAFEAASVGVFLLEGADVQVGVFILVFAGLAAIGTTALLASVLRAADRSRVPIAIAATTFGGALLLTLVSFIPASRVGFSDHMAFDEPVVAFFRIIRYLIPAGVGTAVLVSKTRAVHNVALGVALWALVHWAATGASTRDLDLGNDLGPGFYLQALALLIMGLGAIGGAQVRWRGNTLTAVGARDYAQPITGCVVLVILLLLGVAA